MYKEIITEKRSAAQAMLMAGEPVWRVAKATGLSRATVYRIKHEHADEDVQALASTMRREMADRYAMLAGTILMGIEDFEIDQSFLKEKAIAAAIFTDKAILLDRVGRELVEQDRKRAAKEKADRKAMMKGELGSMSEPEEVAEMEEETAGAI
jgi:hypothetical protein